MKTVVISGGTSGIGKRLVEGYLHQPYSWFLSRHSSDLGTNILDEDREIDFMRMAQD